MSASVKDVFKLFIPSYMRRMKRGYQEVKRRNLQSSFSDVVLHGRPVLPNAKNNYMDDYVRQFCWMTKQIRLNLDCDYVYAYDPLVVRILDRAIVCSVTVDFGIVLKSDLNELRTRLGNSVDESFKKRELGIIDAIEVLAMRVSKELRKANGKRASVVSKFFPSLLYREPNGLDEALQKILFYDSLFWQAGHRHIGLGRLDFILKKYYQSDLDSGKITKCEAKDLLRWFIQVIGKDTDTKSAEIIGDTGQYILLGGIDSTGIDVCNDITEMFLDIISELKIPDPKLILRANEYTPDAVWEKSIKCIMTGVGSPLIMGEKLVMDKMISYGYKSSDVWNVGTSACWEPLIIGKSFDQNNPFESAIALAPLNQLILEGRNINTFEEFYEAYKFLYRRELERVVMDMKFDCSPLFTLFFDDCIERERDFTDGGAIYSHHGAQVVSLPNTINALLNIKRFVFEESIVTLEQCKIAIENNFEGMEDIRQLLISTGQKFGSTDESVLSLTNDLIGFTSEIIKNLSCNGQTVKVGFSSPSYISSSKDVKASLDGRKDGDPFAVHISPISSQIDISEILDFSTKLDYGDNCINGNVVDFILPSSYIKQTEKLIGLLKNAISKGMFEIQLNVLDKNTLIDAKAHPEKYPHLVVRVWGFSAYFNDLPEEFKDNLIRRASVYEAA